MKKIVSFVSLYLVMILVLSSAPVLAATEKAATINVGKVLNGYSKTKDNERILQEAGKKKEQERDGLVQSIRQMKDELALLSDDARAKKQEALDSKIKELQDFDNQAKQELGNQRNTMLREILKDIDDTVKLYGERKGLDFIFSENALLYFHARFDATEDILSELNKNYPKKK